MNHCYRWESQPKPIITHPSRVYRWSLFIEFQITCNWICLLNLLSGLIGNLTWWSQSWAQWGDIKHSKLVSFDNLTIIGCRVHCSHTRCIPYCNMRDLPSCMRVLWSREPHFAKNMLTCNVNHHQILPIIKCFFYGFLFYLSLLFENYVIFIIILNQMLNKMSELQFCVSNVD